jgi:hypothetical protein
MSPPFLFLRAYPCSERFLFGAEVLRLQNLLLGPPGSAPFLTPDLLHPHPFRGDETDLQSFDPVEEQPAGKKPVQRLGALLLALDRKAGRQMDEMYTGRGFVDLLAAGARGSDKGFAEFLLADAEACHPQPERRFFFRGNNHRFKGCSIMPKCKASEILRSEATFTVRRNDEG